MEPWAIYSGRLWQGSSHGWLLKVCGALGSGGVSYCHGFCKTIWVGPPAPGLTHMCLNQIWAALLDQIFKSRKPVWWFLLCWEFFVFQNSRIWWRQPYGHQGQCGGNEGCVLEEPFHFNWGKTASWTVAAHGHQWWSRILSAVQGQLHSVVGDCSWRNPSLWEKTMLEQSTTKTIAHRRDSS